MAAMINKFATAKKTNQKSITLWGDGSALREFLYADDVADAVILCMKEYNSEEPINIASGEEVPLKKLADMIKTATEYTGDIIWDTTKPTGTPAKGLDITKITKMGWQQQYPLSRGIPLAVEWFRNLA
jgi:GDP-L-fucose synthase